MCDYMRACISEHVSVSISMRLAGIESNGVCDLSAAVIKLHF